MPRTSNSRNPASFGRGIADESLRNGLDLGLNEALALRVRQAILSGSPQMARYPNARMPLLGSIGKSHRKFAEVPPMPAARASSSSNVAPPSPNSYQVLQTKIQSHPRSGNS